MTERCVTTSSCSCKRGTHECKLIVVTGGPGAGKTAILELAKKNFCEHIAVLPEAASIVFGGGFWRRDTTQAKKAAQRAIYHVQRELEQLVEDEATSAIALCDRGTLDGLAYWPEEQERFWKELGTTKEKELTRYAAVIHLRTPALEQGYNHSNPVRIEGAVQAAEIDKRIAKAWEGHPRRFFVESTTGFLEKAAHAIKLIRRELPPCCQEHQIEELSGASRET